MKNLFFIAAILLPTAAWAHVGDHSLLNMSAGLLHPLSGLDHLLALLATGIWLAQSETRHKGALIAGFAGMLIVAIPVGMQFTHLTFEAGIVATLVVLGALIAVAVRGPLVLRATVVLATAAVHGFVHGTELPSGAGVLPFTLGLLGSSLMVIGSATIAGIYSRNLASGMIARMVGIAVIFAGIVLSF